MYIYFPYIDAYLCITQITRFICLFQMGNALSASKVEWEHWDEDEDALGNKRIFYLFPNGEKIYLSMCSALFIDRIPRHIYLSSCKCPEKMFFVFMTVKTLS